MKQQQQLKEQQQEIEAQQQEIEQLKEALDKLKNRTSSNSSIPPSADQLKKPSDKSKRKKGKKRGPKYDHPGKTRNGFGEPDQIIELERETTYCIDGIKYWLWVATSDQVCVLLLAPTRSSAELKQLLGEDFEGILSSDCFSAYTPLNLISGW